MRRRKLLRYAVLGTVALACGAAACRANAQVVPDPSPAPSATEPPNPQSHSPSADPTRSDAQLPGAIYEQAMHPLDIVRQSLDNWSDSELAALHLGMKMAHDACDKMDPDDYTKDDLYDLAHLCAFGQDWNPANTAAQRYLRSKAPEHRAQAYAISIGAFVRMDAIDLALATTREMLEYQPYDAEVAYAVRYMKDFLESAGDPEALNLASEEHSRIIDALSKGTPLKAIHGDAVVSTGLLYETAMKAAFFARYAGEDAQAATYLGDVERALPQNTTLTAEDRQEIDNVSLQYHLLGTKLDPFPVARSYKSATARAKLETDSGAASAFVVFPDWCVQCKKMIPAIAQFGIANAANQYYAYTLVFHQAGETSAADSQRELLGTDALEISEETVRTFGATDYPLGIVVDHAGIIRFIGILPNDAFNAGGYMERVIKRMVGSQVRSAHSLP